MFNKVFVEIEDPFASSEEKNKSVSAFVTVRVYRRYYRCKYSASHRTCVGSKRKLRK